MAVLQNPTAMGVEGYSTRNEAEVNMVILEMESDLQYMFLAYLDTALRRQRMKYMRRLQKQVEHEIPVEDMDQLSDPYADAGFNQDITAVFLCASISERDRRIVYLHVISGIELCAIARNLEISVSATQKAYQRALAKMRVTALERT